MNSSVGAGPAAAGVGLRGGGLLTGQPRLTTVAAVFITGLLLILMLQTGKSVHVAPVPTPVPTPAVRQPMSDSAADASTDAEVATPTPVATPATTSAHIELAKQLASRGRRTPGNSSVGVLGRRKPLHAPPRTLESSDARIEFLTVQTKGSPGWCRMQKSALLSGVEVHNLGWGLDYAHRKRPEWILQWISGAQKQEDAAASSDGGATSSRRSKGAKDASFDDPPEAVPGAGQRRQGARDAAAEANTGSSRPRPLHDWDVIMFVDGGDSAFTGVDPATILTRFQGLTVGDVDTSMTDPSHMLLQEAQDAQQALQERMGPELMAHRNDPVPLLFNAEANCYHQQLFDGVWAAKKSRCITQYKKYNPFARSKWRYLNAGGWIGYVWAVKRLFESVRGILAKDKSLWCDQSVVGGLLLRREHDSLLHIDTANAIFLPTYHLRPNDDLCPTDIRDVRGDGVAIVAEEEKVVRQLRLCHSLNYPAVLHFNGKSEAGSSADELLQRSAWFLRASSDKGRAGGAKLLQQSSVLLESPTGSVQAKPYSSVCPGFAKLP